MSKSFTIGEARKGLTGIWYPSYKVKLDTLDKSTPKYRQMFDLACNYLYRWVVEVPYYVGSSSLTSLSSYGALIVLANYLIERKAAVGGEGGSFPSWLKEHREVFFFFFACSSNRTNLSFYKISTLLLRKTIEWCACLTLYGWWLSVYSSLNQLRTHKWPVVCVGALYDFGLPLPNMMHINMKPQSHISQISAILSSESDACPLYNQCFCRPPP